jgi:predicted O-methyltransferase YrrM
MSPVTPLPYVPARLVRPPRLLDGDYGTSSWIGLECLLADLLDRWCPARAVALEFGVEHGYSAVALANYFATVIGIDPFGQQTATAPIEPMRDRARRNVAPYANIVLVEEPWQQFTAAAPLDARYDLVHVDAEHGYYDTFGIGDWACAHARVVLFHDTISFPDTVMPAVCALAERHSRVFYNYDQFHGLGILVNP